VKRTAGKLKRRPVLDRWLDLLEDEPPRVSNVPILHHYTDAYGLHGVITSNSLWATAAQFSNDLSEIEYAASVAAEVIPETWGRRKTLSSWEQLLVDHVTDLVATPFHTFGQPFIISFCEKEDLLSQWQGYGRKSGFSLAFNPLFRNEQLQLSSRNGFRTQIRQVIYDQSRQKKRLRYIFEKFADLVNGFSFAVDSTKGKAAHVELSILLILEMTDWACAVKHGAFSAEQEWRIITYPKEATLVGTRSPKYGGVLVRPTSELLLPYMILEPPARKLLPLVGVRCGPSRFQEQSARALKILLINGGYKDVPITFSSVPLRV
jgi:hypothetical protein